MAEQKKKRKWLKISLILVVVIGLAGFGALRLMDYLGSRAMEKIVEQAKTGELALPTPQATEGSQSDEQEKPEQTNGDQPQPSTEQAGETAGNQVSGNGTNGGVATGGAVDLSYASAIASVASGADISAAYAAVLGCLSAADKAQVAYYMANGQESAAYSLVSSRITGEAYQTLLGLYYKYLPMVQ